jgi:hypothetical protein
MVCNICGKTLKDTAKFCGGCGSTTTSDYIESSVAAVSIQPSVAQSVTQLPVAQELLVGCVSHPAITATEKCHGCGKSYCQDCLIVNAGGKYCLNCSASLRVSESQGLQPYQDSLAYSSPGVAVAPQTQYYAQSTPDYRFARFSPYYQQEFGQITASGEIYKGKWNWAAFFFGSLWALTKGAWATFLVHFAIVLVLGGITCGWGLPLIVVFPIIYGLRGNYIFYCAAVKNKQIVF